MATHQMNDISTKPIQRQHTGVRSQDRKYSMKTLAK